MKNLKKALSLVLASAMLIGMMVVGTGAAHSDVKAEHNEVAIAVVSAAGIMGAGKEFNPDGEITRGEMAVIMTNMLGLDTKEFQGASNFADAGWAADYIDACYANGVMAGISATQFGTNVKLTTAQAALMMLKALGYYEVATLPSNWDMAVVEIIRAASKDECNILDGIKAKAYGNITRNEVAQMILNTLCTEMVEETVPAGSNTTSIKGEGFEITFGNGGAVEVEGLDEYLIDEFEIWAEETETALGLPAYTWFMENEDEDEDDIEIIVDVVEPKAVLTATKDTTALDLYKDKENKKFAADVEGADKVHAGDVVYYYAIEDSKDLAAYAVCYELTEIKTIKETTKKNVTTVKVNGITVAEGVEVDVEKGDWALIAKYDEKIGDIKVAEVIEGKVTALKSGKYTIDGDKYVDVTGEVKVGAEIKAALDNAGRVAAIIEAKAVTSDDFAYIYNVVANTEKGELNADGFKAEDATSFTAYVVLADGTKDKFVMAEVLDEDENVVNLEDLYENCFVAYNINKDDEFEVVEADGDYKYVVGAELDKDNKSLKIDGEKVYANSKTEFVFMSSKKNVWTVTTATGIKNVEIDNDVFVIYDEDEMTTVFVMGKDMGLTVEADTEYAIVMDAAAEITENDDEELVYTYVVYADGEETELTFEKAQDFEVNDLVAYKMDGEYAELAKNELVTLTIAYIGEDFIEVVDEDGNVFEVTADDADVYSVTEVEDKDDEIVFEYDGAELEKDLVIEALLNSKGTKIELAFFYVELDEEA